MSTRAVTSAPSAGVLRWGGQRARTGWWRGDPAVAYLAPAPGPPPSPEFVARCLVALEGRGFSKVVTPALSPLEQTGFVAAGFEEHERLHLLGIRVDQGLDPLPSGAPLRRARRRRRGAVLDIDGRAFSPFWQFDPSGLAEALHATPSTWFRVALDGPVVIGYAICGRAGAQGYVQRLAVDPDHHGQGTGRRLLMDGLHWMRRRGVTQAVVNTQVGNHTALALYRRVGFRDEPSGLAVLYKDLA